MPVQQTKPPSHLGLDNTKQQCWETSHFSKSGVDNTSFLSKSDFHPRFRRTSISTKLEWRCPVVHSAVYKTLIYLKTTNSVTATSEIPWALSIHFVLLYIKGLRQGCVLSPVLFSLYINSLVTELKDRECGVVCGDVMVPGLLFADDTALLTESADNMRKSFQCLQSWCEKNGLSR